MSRNRDEAYNRILAQFETKVRNERMARRNATPGHAEFYPIPEEFGASVTLPPPAEVSPRASVLREAESLITGDRNKAYGSPTQNFTNTAEIWTALLRHKLKDGEQIDPAEVASLMIGLKLARTVGQPKRDNWVDMAGYAGCGYEASEEKS